MTDPFPPVERSRIGGCVLAGGRGARMGGRDKGLLELDGEPLAQRAARQLGGQVADLVVNANRNLDAYRALNVTPVPDVLGGFVGPLAGMHAALAYLRASHDAVAFVPCDAPSMPEDLVARLASALPGHRAAYAFAAGHHQATFCLVRTSACGDIEHYLSQGRRRLEDFFVSIGAIAVDFGNVAERFANLNSPDQWRHYAARLLP